MSPDSGTALQPGRQSETLSQKKKKVEIRHGYSHIGYWGLMDDCGPPPCPGDPADVIGRQSLSPVLQQLDSM